MSTNLYDDVSANLVHQFTVALKAKELYKRDKDYIVQGGEVKIVDEFTGRILEGRRWSEGIHQAVEAKEGVKIKEENQTLATITLQNYFRMYDKLAGMTGTAQTEAAELMNTYGLGVVPVPTNRPLARADQADLIYKGEPGKFSAIIDDIEERHANGQPVLVGTISVAKSELLSRMMLQRGIPHEVLNAKQHTREADIVAQAGRLGGVTVATNMAGRGVDIQLGGNPELMARHEVLKEGFGADLLDDEFELPRPLHEMPDEFQEQRIKAFARYEELLAVFKRECAAEGDRVREAGGLYVIGSERHDSRRIDNQLRGRSGRQGDPGESRFFLSLDDELMRLFATGALQWAMGRFDDDEAIEAKMVTKAIERAQTTVETKNAEIRKNVLKYDEVMNEQRKVIYLRRDQILEGLDLKSAAMEYLAEAVDALIESHCQSVATDEWDIDGLAKELILFWPTTLTAESLAEVRNSDELYDVIMAEATNFYEQRELEMGDEVMREVERQVMLRIIDQRWREHLEEMDYLKEGINLRAMGQKDPLVEWQREGYEMFGGMMKGIAQDFVRYVMHVQVREQDEQPKLEPKVINLQTSSSDDAPVASGFDRAAAQVRGRGRGPRRGAPAGAAGRHLQAHHRRQGRLRQDAAQRSVPVRFGQEVQAMPRRSLNRIPTCVTSPTTCANSAAASTRPATTCKIDEGRDRLTELESEMQRPDLWDDAELAKRVNSEYSNVKDDVDTYDGLSSRLDDAEMLHEMAREEDDASQEPEIEAETEVGGIRTRPARAAQPVHRRARRLAVHRADQRQRRWCRRPGLRRDAAADVRPLGREARLRDHPQL